MIAREKMEDRLSTLLAALRGAMEISIEYSMLAFRLMESSGHEVEFWEPVSEGHTMMVLRCATCGATAQIGRGQVAAHDYMTLELPVGECLWQRHRRTDAALDAAQRHETNDAPNGDTHA